MTKKFQYYRIVAKYEDAMVDIARTVLLLQRHYPERYSFFVELQKRAQATLWEVTAAELAKLQRRPISKQKRHVLSLWYTQNHREATSEELDHLSKTTKTTPGKVKTYLATQRRS
eukprot:TRINITY_DN1003_c0_g1_i4.p1 TRINITY_DN1003_c0_g1~~TRINITY_DN1003_c0_g1_i4.p1  ORF type:complete len:132 (-),score=25.25 TRINITY_DN1003_c0_g1_i4:200-544(-)